MYPERGSWLIRAMIPTLPQRDPGAQMRFAMRQDMVKSPLASTYANWN